MDLIGIFQASLVIGAIILLLDYLDCAGKPKKKSILEKIWDNIQKKRKKRR